MNKIYENIKKGFESKILVGFLYGIASVIIALLIFSIGVSVGVRKASFGRAWGDNYERNFGMRPGKFLIGKDNFPNSHGAIGKIIKIEDSTFIVKDKDAEKTILVDKNTQMQKMMNAITLADLKVDDFVVVIGSPNDQGQIEAKLVRVMPSPELMPESGRFMIIKN